MPFFSLIYFNNQTLNVSDRLTIDHQEVEHAAYGIYHASRLTSR
jgi:hypothetical protein